MTRKLPNLAVPLWKEPDRRTEWTLQLKVITPMFGGGYKAREVDPVCIIRPAAIRGHLRFWWRAIQDKQYSNAKELFEEEGALWGSVDTPGRVCITVENVTNMVELMRLDRAPVPDYVRAILIQETPPTEKQIRRKAKKENWSNQRRDDELKKSAQVIDQEKDKLYPFVARSDVSFGLKVTFDGVNALERKAVARALKAYAFFGGVGGRTRRGYGSLELLKAPNEVANESLEVKSVWWSGIGNFLPGCVSLCGARLYVGSNSDSKDAAWEDAAKIFRQFRKAELPRSGRPRPNKGNGSHSTWPEADMIRQMQNPPIPVINSIFGGRKTNFAFPRAQLGLPLVFQSMPQQFREFGKAELKLLIGDKEFSRLASSVILKPIKVDGKWYPAILILNQTPIRPGDLRVSVDAGATSTVDCSKAPVSLWNGSAEKAFSHSHSSVLDVLEEYLKSEASWTKKDLCTL